ncbi:LysR family transcriptional regulator [Mesorhizobium sp.]|uniref:LysR family transcriptional regulator n=1 Tax=Mesorhizobium sp. TaxID=1871066 RepID=UPI000FE91D30|nr:LysR family transcriptional regulator [Mesorhizobium sp.]RWK60484.1 MAG: LysR family transcriptional regulator [Mesorhizobium sp.]RWM43581.1 MAG: LysR family transcriptional regulator [Mesorhizobium sp.]RWM61415.1 MAG: LysR family transcriptional regulator [Mesorhizobium sp.]RWM97367.1 MAG: LysR family transcriptional regulator [Mesorhizobium sp.]TIO65249.1 MAG: LysR family transcriptional regulator [Mesorhizobium sp.]
MLNKIDLSRTDLNLLVLFEIVHEERHVGRAAEKLNLTPSAVSHGLGRLRRLLNDPLFVRTPKGVVPTARAMELASPIADVLARVRSVISTAEPFDPANSTRRFTIGAPDGVAAVFLPPLLAELGRAAPGIDIGVRQLLPTPGETSPERAWRSAFADLEAGAMDIAVIPSGHIPTRFHARSLYNEDFVLAMQAGHPFADDPTLERYCEMKHLVVSFTGDPHGFVDEVLATQGFSRRIALTVPSFMFALSVLADTDLISALPKRFVAMHAARFGVVSLEAPLPLTTFQLNAIAPTAAMMDAGLAWIFDLLAPRHNAGVSCPP